MAGSATYTPSTIPLARKSVAIAIFLYDPTKSDASEKWHLQPQLRLLSLEKREGAHPDIARFRYAFADPFRDPEDPKSLDEVYSLNAVGPRVIKQDDRLVAVVVYSDGTHKLLFSGFVQAPQGDLGEETETATITALCDAVRESDIPLSGAVLRDADQPLTGDDTQTGSLPIRFNPNDEPNATPIHTDDEGVTGDSGESPNLYPVFLGPNAPDGKINGQDLRLWTLPMAVRYLFNRGPLRPDGKGGLKLSPFVTFSDLTSFDTLLQTIAPYDAQETGDDDTLIDTSDPDTYKLEDIEIQDVDMTGLSWTDALWRLVEPYGFGMAYVLVEGEPDDDNYPGDPHYEIDLYRKDYTTRLKSLYLQPAGSRLDPGKTNLQDLSMSRDSSGLVNRVDVDAAPVRVEAGWVLAAGFEVDDTDVDNLSNFNVGDPGFTGDSRLKYRLWVFDEAGEGHWNFTDADVSTDKGDFSPAFLPLRKDKQGRDATKRYWAIRRRAGSVQASLAMSQYLAPVAGYAGTAAQYLVGDSAAEVRGLKEQTAPAPLLRPASGSAQRGAMDSGVLGAMLGPAAGTVEVIRLLSELVTSNRRVAETNEAMARGDKARPTVQAPAPLPIMGPRG